MALDNAQFISELSVTDPPGTDPLNQGDDHIRTTKLAVQQSFPNVGSAVPQTGVQMAQMAIKNEVNTFTAIQVFNNQIQSRLELSIRPLSTSAAAIVRWKDTADIRRWSLDKNPEITNDDLVLNRYNSAGTFLDSPLTFANATGQATFANATNMLGALLMNDAVDSQTASINFRAASINRWRTLMRNSAGGNDYEIIRHNAGGTQLDVPIRIAASSGQVTFANITLMSNRLDMSEKVRFNNFNSNHGLTWRANGAITWELIAVHSNAPLTRLTFDRYVGGVFQDQPLQIHNDTGHVNMPVLPTGPGGSLVSGSLYAKQSQLFAGTELVVGVQP